jgi:hypothetical protein
MTTVVISTPIRAASVDIPQVRDDRINLPRAAAVAHNAHVLSTLPIEAWAASLRPAPAVV